MRLSKIPPIKARPPSKTRKKPPQPTRKNSTPGKDIVPTPRELRSVDVGLTEKQRLFVTYLTRDQMNATASARAAGFSNPASSAYDLQQLPKIQHAIAVAREAYAKASDMTRKKVIDGFVEAIDMGRIKADPLAMISGWREIGKMCGFYEPTKTEIRLSVEGKVLVNRLNTMSDEELMQLAAEDSAIIEGELIDIPSPDK